MAAITVGEHLEIALGFSERAGKSYARCRDAILANDAMALALALIDTAVATQAQAEALLQAASTVLNAVQAGTPPDPND